jgi:hypothetical protein
VSATGGKGDDVAAAGRGGMLEARSGAADGVGTRHGASFGEEPAMQERVWKEVIRRLAAPLNRHEHRRQDGATELIVNVIGIAFVSPPFGAHGFIVVLLALLTRRKLLQQIPRRNEHLFAR